MPHATPAQIHCFRQHQHGADEERSQEQDVERGDPAVHQQEVVQHHDARRVDGQPRRCGRRADEQVDRHDDDQPGDQAGQSPADGVVAEHPHRRGDQDLAERRVLAVRVEAGGCVDVRRPGGDRPAEQPAGGVDVVRLVEDQCSVRAVEPRHPRHDGRDQDQDQRARRTGQPRTPPPRPRCRPVVVARGRGHDRLGGHLARCQPSRPSTVPHSGGSMVLPEPEVMVVVTVTVEAGLGRGRGHGLANGPGPGPGDRHRLRLVDGLGLPGGLGDRLRVRGTDVVPDQRDRLRRIVRMIRCRGHQATVDH